MSDVGPAAIVFADGLERSLDGELTLGRGGANAVVIESRTVSRQHARLFEQSDRWFVEDRGSSNGTLLNGQRIPPHVAVRIRHADRVQVGPQVFVLSNPAEVDDPERTVSGPELIATHERLSSLQQQIVTILCEDWVKHGTLERLPSNDEIAERLGTPGAGKTVKSALRRMYAKAGVTHLPAQDKRRALCRAARNRGWI